VIHTVSPVGLAYPAYDRRGFVGAKKNTSVGLLVFNPLCLKDENENGLLEKLNTREQLPHI
jgi:hypothetical protein